MWVSVGSGFLVVINIWVGHGLVLMNEGTSNSIRACAIFMVRAAYLCFVTRVSFNFSKFRRTVSVSTLFAISNVMFEKVRTTIYFESIFLIEKLVSPADTQFLPVAAPFRFIKFD